eukprot:12925822-Heterocapsa_arctica.AAC.1
MTNSVKAGDGSLTGQLGVGFYSAFVVANKLEISSRCRKDQGEDRESWKWISEGNSFTVWPAPEEEYYGETSGTKI